MVEKYVIDGKTGKSVQKPADDSQIFISYIAPEENIAGKRRARKFEHQKRRHQIRDRLAREWQCQPEKWAAEQIKGVRTNHVYAQISRMAPTEIPAADTVVNHLIKGNLLYIEIAVIKEQSLIVNQKGEEKQKRKTKAQQKRFMPISFLFCRRGQPCSFHMSTALILLTKTGRVSSGKSPINPPVYIKISRPMQDITMVLYHNPTSIAPVIPTK